VPCGLSTAALLPIAISNFPSPLVTAHAAATASDGTTASNAAYPGEAVFYNPSDGEDLVLPKGYKIDVFAKGLDFPTGIAFMRTATTRLGRQAPEDQPVHA
jgi:hypothetical protein